MEVEDGEAEEGELEEGEAAEEPKDVAMPDAEPEGMLLHIITTQCKSYVQAAISLRGTRLHIWRCL